jgi:hypothetical protein
MLDKLRDHALRAIAAAPACTLSTAGPAGLQASRLDCRVHEKRIFVDVPAISDHLFNLEHEEQVLLTADGRQLRGKAKRLELFEGCHKFRVPAPRLG